MVEKTYKSVTEEDIQVLDINGSTALAAAAGVGATSIAECMIKKNSKLVEIPGQHFLPVTMACNNGHKDTAKYLYSITPFELLLPENGKYGSLLLHVYIFNHVFGLTQIYDRKLTHVYALEPLHLMSEEISTVDDNKINESGLYEAFRTAIKYGIIEIVIEMLKANPVLLTVVDTNRRSIIHYAVQHRQQKIFNLIYVSHTRNYMLTSGIDNQKNNILHIAAMLAPPDRLACFLVQLCKCKRATVVQGDLYLH
ncbi:hypothetical protein GH714_005607 [Hevea brasiliensis]|uniref:PGG domain-containing protein n=1 Tax=Hevea brasiliensis TaxID=3981 RepID=A0A6A6N1A1_HEVBR|nr:hypothetical protein GH714_005607 [Hevea brasiliensis]